MQTFIHVISMCCVKTKVEEKVLQKFKGIKDIKSIYLQNIGRISDVHQLSIVRKRMNWFMCLAE